MFAANVIYNDTNTNIEFPCDNNYLYSKLSELHVPEEKYTDLKLFVEKIEFEALSCFEEDFVDLGELNFLAQRIDSLDAQEQIKFCTVATEFGLKTMTEFINLTYNLQYYTLIQDLSSAEKIGKTYMLTRNSAMSDKEILKTDFSKIGKQLIESGRGRFTDRGILFVNDDMPYEHVYNGVTLPEFGYYDYLLAASIEYNGKKSYVYLPDVPYAISNAVSRLGVSSAMDCKTECIDISIENDDWSMQLKSIAENEGIYKLNEVVNEINMLSGSAELRKLTDVIEFAGKSDSDTIVKLAENINEFIFYPDVSNADDLGRAMIEENEDYQIHEDIADYFMFEEYAETVMSGCDCKFTVNGAVLLENKTLTEILGEEQNSAMTMGGM